MFDVTEEDMKALLEHHTNPDVSRRPAYSLKELVRYGMMYAYGDRHFREDRVFSCGKPFSLFEEHVCDAPVPAVEIFGRNMLDRSPKAALSYWAGYNLALVTASSELHAYFKSELLFTKEFSGVSSLHAAADKIYLGLSTGEIVYFDPIAQTKVRKRAHSGEVSSLTLCKGHILSSSMDGSIFYKRRIKVSDSGILSVCFAGDNSFVCACADDTVALYSANGIKEFDGHQSRITTLTRRDVTASTSSDGFLGIICNENSSTRCYQSMTDLGCSMHKQASSERLIGYGKEHVKLFDLPTSTVVSSVPDSTAVLDIKENLVAYGSPSGVVFCDIRERQKQSVEGSGPVADLSFAPAGNLFYVSGPHGPYILDMRML